MNKLISLLLTIGIVGCASVYSQMDQYNNLSGTYKAKAVAVNSYNQLTGGWGASVGSSPWNAKSSAIANCKRYNPRFHCIVEWENNNYVLGNSLASLPQSQPIQQNNTQYNTRPNPWKVIGDQITEMNKPNYGKPKVSICNFKSFEGAIISGDCTQLTIAVGNTTYWRMD